MVRHLNVNECPIYEVCIVCISSSSVLNEYSTNSDVECTGVGAAVHFQRTICEFYQWHSQREGKG